MLFLILPGCTFAPRDYVVTESHLLNVKPNISRPLELENH